MSNSEWDSMNDAKFDDLLQNSLPEPPPDDIADKVTPWRRNINRILGGLALNAITLNFLALDYILPAIGLVLMLLGFRSLRRENRWFLVCFFITVIQAAYFFQALIMNTTIFENALYDKSLLSNLAILSVVLTLFKFFCLWRAFKAVKIKAGLEPNAGSAAAMMVWYSVIAILALSGIQGIVIGIIMVVAYIFIVRSLFKFSKELDEAGYSIVAVPVKVTDRALVIALVIILATGIACGYLFGGSYPMQWKEMQPNEQAEVVRIKAQLTAIGFPAEVLDDLTEEDILVCDGALRVVVDITDEIARKVVEPQDNTQHHYKVYDVKELRITGVAIELPGQREQWKIFHHFRWLIDPGFYGTESLQLWPASHTDEGWSMYSDVTGQVLYTLNGRSYAAQYYSLGSETFTSRSIFWGEQTSTDIFATFSMPRKSENQRGYISYVVAELQDGYIVDSWINYTHQRGWLQYPAMTAAEKRMSSGLNKDGVFFTVQDALQFYPTEDEIEQIS